MTRLGTLIVTLLLAAQAGGALAGAWPRGEDNVFVSFGGDATRPAGDETTFDPSLYVEWGITPRLTLGFDGFATGDGQSANGFVFLRYPFDDGEGANRFAWSVGVGPALSNGGDPVTALRVGLNWGRGLDNGWLALDTQAVLRSDFDKIETKAEFTWGRELAENWTGIVTFQVGTGSTGDAYSKITPSVVWAASDRLSLRAGVTQNLDGGPVSLTLQTWLSF